MAHASINPHTAHTIGTGLTMPQLIRYHLMRLNLGYDLPYLVTGKGTKRAIASPEEVLALRPELAAAGRLPTNANRILDKLPGRKTTGLREVRCC